MYNIQTLMYLRIPMRVPGPIFDFVVRKRMPIQPGTTSAILSQRGLGPMDPLKHPLDWNYMAGWFDSSGSIYEIRKAQRFALEARLRFSSYDRCFLEHVRDLVGGGSITAEPRPKGSYYRLTVTGYYRVESILARLLPHLRRKRRMVKDWLELHKSKAEIGRLNRKLRLKPSRFLRAEVRQMRRAVQQLGPPPLRD